MTLETYLTDLATHLQTNGFGTKGVDITISGYHDAAGNSIFITPYQGSEPYEIVTGEENEVYPNVQFLVRNLEQEVALTKANALFRLFRNVANQTIGTTDITMMRASGPPAFVMKSNGGYYTYSINFSMRISP
jgi:hypothetical protein